MDYNNKKNTDKYADNAGSLDAYTDDELKKELHSRRRRSNKARIVRAAETGSDKAYISESEDAKDSINRLSDAAERKKDGEFKTAAKTKKKKKHPVLWVLLAMLLIAAAFLAYKFFTRQSGYYTVAVFGVDSRDGNVGKGALSDVNIIARVDMSTGEIKLVSVYRDTYTKIDEDGNYHKFNEAYFRGGPEQGVWALEHNTDVKVDDYVTFNWKAVVDAINILGGVDIDISDAEFEYINAYITETVNGTGVGSVQLEHSGLNHLDGVQAVAYARLRNMDNDFTRTERQRKVISLAFEKAKAADFSVLYNILVTVLPQTSTSVGIDDLLPFAKGIGKYYLGDTAGFPFDRETAKVGKMSCVIPVTWESNDTALHEFLYPGEAYTPSSEVREISGYVAEKTGLGASGETSVKVDDLESVSGGGTGITSDETSAAAEPETEPESETEETAIEEIFDPFMEEGSDNPEETGDAPDAGDADNDAASDSGSDAHDSSADEGSSGESDAAENNSGAEDFSAGPAQDTGSAGSGGGPTADAVEEITETAASEAETTANNYVSVGVDSTGGASAAGPGT